MARLLNFISEQEVEEIRKKRGERGETESTLPDRPLFEILKENKDKQQAEFNERFKHQPPKALDEDETDFLEKVAMHQKEQELQVANEEAQQLLNFQLAVASRTLASREPLPSFNQAKQEVPASQKEKRRAPPRSILSTIKIKAQPKKAKVETSTPSKEQQQPILISAVDTQPSPKQADVEDPEPELKSSTGLLTSLVAYGTDSDEDD